jgi:hypothetical protein
MRTSQQQDKSMKVRRSRKNSTTTQASELDKQLAGKAEIMTKEDAQIEPQ